MRSTAQGSFAAMLLLIPILAVPMLAIFGVPDFAPVVESPLGTAEANSRPPVIDAPPFVQPVESPGTDFTPPAGSTNAVAAWPGPSQGDPELARLQAIRHAGFTRQAGEPRPVELASHALPTTDSPFRNVDEAEALPVTQVSAIPQTQLSSRGMAYLPGTTPSSNTESAAPLTWRGAVQRLNHLEIRNFRLEPGRTSDQFVFICSYTPRDNPRVSYRFEAEADEPLKAVERVLSQIDNWLASR